MEVKDMEVISYVFSSWWFWTIIFFIIVIILSIISNKRDKRIKRECQLGNHSWNGCHCKHCCIHRHDWGDDYSCKRCGYKGSICDVEGHNWDMLAVGNYDYIEGCTRCGIQRK
jgi:hypothetical protein